jgi:hypothetical protein
MTLSSATTIMMVMTIKYKNYHVPSKGNPT